MSGGIFIFIFALLFIVMVHEAGHLLMAKAFGFKATRFFVGMGPTIWSTQKGETEYGIKALPIGGFVKIVGMSPYEEIAPEDLPRAYPNKPKWQRALVLLGGPATHWILAFFILVAASMAIGSPTGDVTNKIEVVEKRFLGTELPSAAIDLEPGERIVAVGGNATDDWDDILSYIRGHGGEQATFDIASGETVERRSVELGWAVFENEELFAYVPPDAGLVELRRSGQPVGFVPYRLGDRVVGFLGVQPEILF
ncbi:MAG: site-2 protease family protein, partial [Actinomycetota bacterium]|nr:site-2 protease family protein [Actinomycetota bacterium]